MNILKTMAVIGAMSLGATTAYAATDGNLQSGGVGTGSTGTFDINVSRQDSVRITGMTDVNITTSGTATGAQSQTNSVCYYATTANYSVDISSTNNFQLTSGANNMAYTVRWTDDVAGTQNFNNNADTALVAVSQNTLNETCGGGTNAAILVNITAAQFDGKPVGSYTDTVSVVIALQ